MVVQYRNRKTNYSKLSNDTVTQFCRKKKRNKTLATFVQKFSSQEARWNEKNIFIPKHIVILHVVLMVVPCQHICKVANFAFVSHPRNVAMSVPTMTVIAQNDSPSCRWPLYIASSITRFKHTVPLYNTKCVPCFFLCMVAAGNSDPLQLWGIGWVKLSAGLFFASMSCVSVSNNVKSTQSGWNFCLPTVLACKQWWIQWPGHTKTCWGIETI